MLTIEQLESTHDAYKKVAEQANYFYQSYVGGYSYKAGSHLTHYLNENTAPGDQYSKRVKSTPLDNHVQTTIDIYRSFLFRNLPKRELGLLANNPLVADWITDVDMEGQGMDSFLKTANDLAMVTGSVWILIDKPVYKVETQAQEIALGLRAYACVYTPQNVLDWRYSRNLTGRVELQHIKVREEEDASTVTISVWTPTTIERYTVVKHADTGEWDYISDHQEYENPLGYVPFVQHMPLRSPVRGVGHSLVADVCDQQKYIYNLLSELEQQIRISGHPTLVKTPSTSANAGAGAIINVQEDTDPNLKPYLLQPTSAGVDGILATIQTSVEAIQRMTHTYAVQATASQAKSGVAIQSERTLLNAKLADISDTLRETELKMWRIWCDWAGLDMPVDFEIQYADSFDMRDKVAELDFLLKAKSAGITNPEFIKAIDYQIMELTIEDSEMYNNVMESTEYASHNMMGPDGSIVSVTSAAQHEELEAQGYTNL